MMGARCDDYNLHFLSSRYLALRGRLYLDFLIPADGGQPTAAQKERHRAHAADFQELPPIHAEHLISAFAYMPFMAPRRLPSPC
jgi:hypothetical protein